MPARVTIGLVFATLAMLSFVTGGLLANHLVDRGNPPVVVAFYEALFGLALHAGHQAAFGLRSGGILRIRSGLGVDAGGRSPLRAGDGQLLHVASLG